MSRYRAVGIILLLLGTSMIPGTAQNTEKPVSTTRGNWLYVGGSGPGNYTKIQDAVDNASDGDSIYVYHNQSPYYENIIVNTALHLIGEDKNTTIIDASGKSSSGNAVTIDSDWVNISGFTIQNSRNGSKPHSGISMYHSCYNNITGNIILQNDLGIRLSNTSNHNTISKNIFTNNSYGIAIFHDSNFNDVIKNNVIKNKIGIELFNHSDFNNIISNNITHNKNGNGIHLDGSNNNTISSNTIFYNYYDSIYLSFSDNNTIVNNTIKNGFNGILVSYAGNNTISENTISNNVRSGINMRHSDFNTVINNTIIKNNDSGLFLEYSTKTDITRNNISENRFGIYLHFSNDIIISKNNYIKNIKDAFFNTSKKNTWDHNYWNRTRILPKLIFGQLMVGSFKMSWINIDWHPALKPYDIPGMT